MTRNCVPLRRIAALSVAITLLAAPIAAAQSPEALPPIAGPANPALLNEAAFARLIQAPARVAPAPGVADSARPSLLRQGTAAVARQAPAAATKAPQQKSWASRHKMELVFIIAGAIIGFVLLTVGFPE